MNLMIAVKSCQRDLDLGCHEVIRQTWGRDARALGIDVRFFVGSEFKKYLSDETHLKCPDDYNSLPFKTREICKWATGKMVDYLFLCDTDTFIIPERLLKSGFEGYDYVGKIDRPLGAPFSYTAVSREGAKEIIPRCFPWASGGYGYFLSRKAFTEVAYTYPTSWAEDLWVGQVLGPMIALGEIKAMSVPPHIYSPNLPSFYSWHFPSSEYKQGYDPVLGWMKKMYKDFQ